MVSTLATHASGPGSIPVAGGKKERLISLLLNIRGCALLARISHKTEVPSPLTLRVEVKEPTDVAPQNRKQFDIGLVVVLCEIRLPKCTWILRHIGATLTTQNTLAATTVREFRLQYSVLSLC